MARCVLQVARQALSVVIRQQLEGPEVESMTDALRYTPCVVSEYRGASNMRDKAVVRGLA